MNIKHIIKSQKLRHRLMRLGKFLPDSLMISLQYKILLGRWPNLKNPKRFTEWIQWYKIHYRDPKMLRCVDKYEVRGYIEEKGYGKYLNELYQICDVAEEIDFYKLPQKFVIKTTSGGNGDNVLIVKDKSKLNIKETIETVNSWLFKNYSDTSREWAYSEAAKNPKIIVERFLENGESGLDDYKFYCFNGKHRFLSIDKDRYGNHTRAYFNENGEFLSEVTGNYNRVKETPNLPDNISELIETAEKLATDFPFVRVDLYNVNNKVIFGELTFYPASGYSPYHPDHFDLELGAYFKNCKILTLAHDKNKREIGDGSDETLDILGGGGGGKYLIIKSLHQQELLDYKFYCFNGQPFVCQLISGRYTEEYIDFYDLKWNRLKGIVGLNQKAKNSPQPHIKPINLDIMIKVAKKLSEDFPFVRVDLYNIDGMIYFGELTFYPGSGYGSFVPDSFDTAIGQKFEIIRNKKWIKYIHAGK